MPREPKTDRKELTPYQRGQIIGASAVGCSQREIERTFGHPRWTIRTIIDKENEDPEWDGASAPRAGPRKTTSLQDKAIGQALKDTPNILLRVLNQTICPEISLSSMKRRLREQGLRKWKKIKRPVLTELRASKKLKWAQQHKDWTVEQWQNVLWSDECSVERGSGRRAEYVFRTSIDKWLPFAIQPTFRSGRVSVMVWAAFNGRIRSELVFCEKDPEARRGGVSGRMYLKLLQDQLPSLCDINTIFMQDNAQIHIYKPVKEWLASTGYQIMDWPPFSPDLNPIENTWFPLKEHTHLQVPQLHEITNPDRVVEQLQAALPVAWQRIPKEKFDRLIASMPRRIQAVIDAEGWYTKY